jgi:cold shock CspA family protein
MSHGVMSWFDPSSGEGRVRRRSREFVALTGDVEPAARRAGARVTFDIRRVDGGERAVNVRLRRGRRVSPRQSRFGDLVGAHHADAKGHMPLTRKHGSPDRDRRLEERPAEVARLWMRAVERGDVGVAGQLYASDARLHAGGRIQSGPDAARRYLATSPMRGRHDGRIRLSPDGKRFTVLWPASEHRREESVELLIAHGQITEQWAV